MSMSYDKIKRGRSFVVEVLMNIESIMIIQKENSSQ